MKVKELKKAIKKQNKEWENSIEGISEIMDGRIFGVSDGNRQDKLLILKTILRIPKKYRQKIIESDTPFFVMTESLSGCAEKISIPFHKLIKSNCVSYLAKKNLKIDDPKNYKLISIKGFDTSLILLNFHAMKNKSEFFIMSTIAHEIAHVLLGDYGEGKAGKQERSADDLTEKWGFKRAYTEKQYQELEK